VEITAEGPGNTGTEIIGRKEVVALSMKPGKDLPELVGRVPPNPPKEAKKTRPPSAAAIPG
jgi:hypothetical protein